MSSYSDEEITQFIEVLPSVLLDLAKELSSRSRNSAVRHLVSRTGSVRREERFDDDVVDAVFLRIQSRSQHGLYDSEDVIMSLGREARRMEGDGEITLYRAAPKGVEIRPGDFATDSAGEASFYKHGGHRITKRRVPQKDVFCVRGSCGGGQEYIYLPPGHVRGPVSEFFGSFNEFFAFATDLAAYKVRAARNREHALEDAKPFAQKQPEPS